MSLNIVHQINCLVLPRRDVHAIRHSFYFHKNYLLSYEKLWNECLIEWVGFCSVSKPHFPPQSSKKPSIWPLLATATLSALRFLTHVPHQLNHTEWLAATLFCCGLVPLTYITLRELILSLFLSLSPHLFGFVWLCYADAAQPFFFSMTLNEKAVLAALNAV